MIEVFPVPRGYTPEQAWGEIATFGELLDYRWWKPRFWFPRWASIEVESACKCIRCGRPDPDIKPDPYNLMSEFCGHCLVDMAGDD